MMKIINMYLHQIGFLKILLVIVSILTSALIITAVILHGLEKDGKLLELLPNIFLHKNMQFQFWTVFYYFLSLFLRAGILLFQGLLAFQIISLSQQNTRLQHVVTYPMTRVKIMIGMFSTVCLFSGVILFILHGAALVSIYFKLNGNISVNFVEFLFKDFALDILYVLVGMIPCSVAFIKPKIGLVIGTSILLIVISCNAATASFKPTNINISAVILITFTLIGLFMTLFSIHKFNMLDF